MNRLRHTLPTEPPAHRDPAPATERRHRLEALTDQARRIILARQDAHTGLLPASTAVTVHGDYTHAWVRDNVYSILAVWALAGAWRDEDPAQAVELNGHVERLMRGLLAAMMRQAHKVERFKHTQDPLDALHAKYATTTGEPVVGDADWGHLQIDATALYVLMLAQMSAAGLAIVRDEAEQAFVQSLVYYLGHAWHTPDYGIWERGHKRNEGVAEINASSVGMAKAALEAIDGVALRGTDAPRVHVPADDVAHARQTLEGLLPRESESKETDGALLAITGYPAYAVDDAGLALRTRAEVRAKLEGRYGARRFLRDGHQTVLEDHGRLHYEPGELARFEHIECEWPLFFCYQLVDAALRGDAAAAADYRMRLEGLMVERDGERLLPELYFVPAEAVEAERAAPHSQTRVPNANLPLVWAQSLYLVGVLLHEGLLAPGRIDPLGRRHLRRPAQAVRVNVAVLASDALVRARLAAHGIASESLDAVQRGTGVAIVQAQDVEPLWRALGRHEGLGLGGRPAARLGPLATSEVYSWRGQRFVVAPALFNRQGSYLVLDNRLLVDDIEAELGYLARHGDARAQPLFALWVSAPMLDAQGADGLLDHLRTLDNGAGGDPAAIPRRVGALADLMAHAATRHIDWLDELPASLSVRLREASRDGSREGAREPAPPAALSADALPPWDEAAARPLIAARAAALALQSDAAALWQRLAAARNPYEQIALLGRLWQLAGPEAGDGLGRSVREHTEAVHDRAAATRSWGLLRRAAAVLDAADGMLEDVVAQLTARPLRLLLGPGRHERAAVARALGQAELHERLRACTGQPIERVLVQEIVLLLGTLAKADASLFDGMLTLRPAELLQLLCSQLADEHGIDAAAAFEHLQGLSPQALLGRLREALAKERACCTTGADALDADQGKAGDWPAWRASAGVQSRLGAELPEQVWQLLHRVGGVVIGASDDSRNRLDPSLARAEMTALERSFALHLETCLDRIDSPVWRQLTIEALRAAAHHAQQQPQRQRAEALVTDDLLADAALGMGPLSGGAPAAMANLAGLPPAALAERLAATLAWRDTAQRAMPSPALPAPAAQAAQAIAPGLAPVIADDGQGGAPYRPDVLQAMPH